MLKRSLFLMVAATTAMAAYAQTTAELTEQVRKAELAFAKTMADRDYRAFTTFLATDAVFSNGAKGQTALRGPAAIGAAWKRFFDGPKAPFSWVPETVEVLESGTLALSSGPVTDAAGKRTGTFNSIWRREPNGSWKVVIDHGCPACTCPPAK